MAYWDHITNKKRAGNIVAVVQFASLCFSPPYATYYTALYVVRSLLVFLKLVLMRVCRL